MTKRNKIRIVIVVITLAILLVFIIPYLLYGNPKKVDEYVEKSQMVELSKVHYLNYASTIYFMSREQYLIQDLKTHKYYILLYFKTEKRSKLLFLSHALELFVYINSEDYERYGTRENPIPVFNYAYKKDGKMEINESDYRSGIRKYLMYYPKDYEYESREVIKKRENIYMIINICFLVTLSFTSIYLKVKNVKKKKFYNKTLL